MPSSIQLRVPGSLPSRPEIRACEILPQYGSATSALRVSLPDGRELPIFTERSAADFASAEKNPNAPFQLWNTPLFPLTNRLRNSAADGAGVKVEAQVAGFPVTAPRNHGECHLHGLLYRASAAEPLEISALRARARYRDFFRGYWTSEADVEVEHALMNGEFQYAIRARNCGDRPMPVGFGSHPYFEAFSGNAENLRLHVPARSFAEIENLENVFPTGRLLPTAGSALDFSRDARPFAATFLDNYWTDLVPNAEGFAYAELIDVAARLRIRMTATTKNVIGIQVYYPKRGTSVAIELVTHHPDPRAEIWGKVRTGMAVLAPGESAEFGFRIEVSAL